VLAKRCNNGAPAPCSGNLDGQQRLIVKGRFLPKGFENVIRRYVNECASASCRVLSLLRSLLPPTAQHLISTLDTQPRLFGPQQCCGKIRLCLI